MSEYGLADATGLKTNMQTMPITPRLELRRYSREDSSHQHEFHQLVLAVDGMLSMTIDSVQGEVAQNQAALIRAGWNHTFSGSADNCFVVADIPKLLMSGWEALPPYLDLDSALTQYIRFMYLELTQAGPHRSRQMLLLLLQLLQQRLGDERPGDRRVQAAIEYIELNVSRNIALQEVAQAANLSQRQLTTLFRKHVGTSPMQYLLSLRMQQAQHLLKTTDCSLQQIAQYSGYENVSAFCSRYKQYFAQSPGYFRRNGK